MGLLTLIEPAIEPVQLADMKLWLRVDASDTADDGLIGSLIVAARRWAEVYTQRRFITQTVRLLMDFFPGYIDTRLIGTRISSPFVSGSNAILVGLRYAIMLPYPIVQSIVALSYLNANGDITVMNPETDYIQDLSSQPARLTPVFGSMWPVARVVPNAVQVDYVTGYGGPVNVATTEGSPVIANAVFLPTDEGRAICIPNAGAAGQPLKSSILSVVNGVGTMSSAAVATLATSTAYLGDPVPEMIQIAIKMLVSIWYAKREPDTSKVPDLLVNLLTPYRDLRL